jgi:hypothetical protein
MRIRMITNTIPENLIFIVNKSKLINRVIMGQWTLDNGDRELVEDHIGPIFPI